MHIPSEAAMFPGSPSESSLSPMAPRERVCVCGLWLRRLYQQILPIKVRPIRLMVKVQIRTFLITEITLQADRIEYLL